MSNEIRMAGLFLIKFELLLHHVSVAIANKLDGLPADRHRGEAVFASKISNQKVELSKKNESNKCR